MNVNRREFLKISAALGGGLLVSLYLPGCQKSPQDDKAWAGDDFTPAAWIRISPDNTITFYLDKSEMGQGVTTSLPMLIAEELDVLLDSVKVEFAPAHTRFDSPRMLMMMTGGSTSVATSFMPMRRAGATARELLISAAAQTWAIERSQCHAREGRVYQTNGRDSLSYGELATRASRLSVSENTVVLKSPEAYRYIGKPIRRLDSDIKINGKAQFGIDVKRPDALVGVVVRSPVFGGRVKTFDASQTQSQNGVVNVFEISTGIAVLADTYWHAREAANQLKIDWDEGAFAKTDEHTIRELLKNLATQPGSTLHEDGDFSEAIKQTTRTLEAHYRVPYLAHATMEPMNCTAYVQADRCDIWVPTQAQSSARAVAAALCGFSLEQVFVNTTWLGGGFGRRAEQDFVVEAVEASKVVGKAVKIVWSREDDMQHDYYRPPSYSVLKAGLNETGQPVAWMHKMVNSSVLSDSLEGGLMTGALPGWLPDTVKMNAGRLGAVLTRKINEPVSTEGGVEIPYTIPNQRVERVAFNLPVPLGFWRSVGHSHTAFMVESFIDELAHLAGQDPYLYRSSLLKDKPRHKAVLERVAKRADWGASLPTGRARGIAQHASFGSFVAQVAEVSMNAEGNPRVHKVFCVIDCGQVVNPDIVKAQMESGIVFGLTAALKGEITLEKGRVQQSNFHDYPLLRMNEMPEIEVEIIESAEAPSGVGEPGTPPIAPAVANALYALTGKRLRDLPLRFKES